MKEIMQVLPKNPKITQPESLTVHCKRASIHVVISFLGWLSTYHCRMLEAKANLVQILETTLVQHYEAHMQSHLQSVSNHGCTSKNVSFFL